MYIPNATRVEEQTQLLAFMQAHSFATMVSMVAGQLFATHLPLTIVAPKTGEEDGAEGRIRLHGHVAKANPHWQELTTQSEVLVIFQGPHAYISPSLYEKRESVPTWNYIAVHAYGAARLIQDEADLLTVLADLIATNDPAYQAQWDSLPDKFRQGLLNGIVAFEINVTRLEGKFKLGQNRPLADQMRMATALSAHADTTIATLGHYVQEQLPQ